MAAALNRFVPSPVSVPGRPDSASQADSGLRTLYRQVRAAARGENAVQAAGVAVVRESVQPESGLTMGQLDRAVRRDSRRYDGGMSIY